MAEISWGKCSLLVGKYAAGVTSDFEIEKLGTNCVMVDTPVNSSTTINIEEGEKHEAEIEGGDNEAVRSDADKYSVEFDIRRAKDRPVIGANGLGQQDGTFVIGIQPENPAAPSILIEAASVKRGISYTSSDGIYDHYTADAIVPKDGKAVKIGILSVDETGSASSAKVDTPIANPAAPTQKNRGFGLKFYGNELEYFYMHG